MFHSLPCEYVDADTVGDDCGDSEYSHGYTFDPEAAALNLFVFFQGEISTFFFAQS